MKEYIDVIRKIHEKNLASIIEEINKFDLEDIEKIHVLKEALELDSEKAQSIFLSKYKGKISDDLLDDFLSD